MGEDTPVLQTLAMALSQYWIDREDIYTKMDAPCFRTAESLDFLRGEPGLVERPDLFDDGDVQKQPATAMKAFLDVSRSAGGIVARPYVVG